MEKAWVKVYVTQNAFTAEVLMQGLLENEIPAVTVDKKFNAYNIGEIHVLVHPDFEKKALEYILENDI